MSRSSHRTVFPVLFGSLLLLVLGWSLPGLAQSSPFRVEVAPVRVAAGGEGTFEVIIAIPEGYHVYRDMVEVTVPDPDPFEVGDARFPDGVVKPDPAFPEQTRELYHHDLVLDVPLAIPAHQPLGEALLDVHVRYQGCKAELCYMPEEVTRELSVEVVAPSEAPEDPTSSESAPESDGSPGSTEGTSHGSPGHDAAVVDMTAFGTPPPLTDEQPVAVRAVAPEPGTVHLGFFQAEGWHVNRDLTDAEVLRPENISLVDASWPEPTTWTDPASGIERREIGGNFVVEANLQGPPGKHDLVLEASFQACKEDLCHMPRYEEIALEVKIPSPDTPASAAPPAGPSESAGSASAGRGATGAPGGSTFESMREKGLIWLILFVFGAGFLVSLTPCVLPMIPITMGIIGAGASGSRLRAFSLSATYVLGLALVYTGLGLTAGLTGSLFGAWMQSPWVVGTVAAFFVAMAFAMFGFFDVGLPAGLATRLNQYGGSGYAGAFVVGMIGAVVAGPCSGPVIASLMVLIGQQGEILLGAALMLSFSLGMGMLFLVAGTFSSTVLRPGVWMDTVKHAFGVLMLLGAIYFVHAHLPDVVVALAAAAVLLATAVYGWPADEETTGFWIARTRKLYTVVAGLVGAWFLLGTLASHGFVVPPLARSSSAEGGPGTAEPGIAWLASEPEALARARAENLPLMVDFTAEWCAACKELEHFTYTDARVVERSLEFVPLIVDATSNKDPEVAALLEKYGVQGLPTVAFVTPEGRILEDLTITGFLKAEPFLARMDGALERMQEEPSE